MNLGSFKDSVRSLSIDEQNAIRAHLQAKKEFKIQIVSASMEPLIMTGETLLLSHWDQNLDSLNVFDIIVFCGTDGFPICHYLYSKNKNFGLNHDRTVVTKGLNSGIDIPINPSQILGIVTDRKISFTNKLQIYLGRKFTKFFRK